MNESSATHERDPRREPSYPMRTERLDLRPFELADLDDMVEYHGNEDVVRYLYWPAKDAAATRELLRQRVERHALREVDEALTLAVSVRATGKVIGEVCLIWRSEENRQAELGFVFNPAFHGHGYATEATRPLLALAFELLGFHRVFGRCDARNLASARLMKRLGMRQEAHFLHSEIFKGEWGDELWFAMLEDEWPAHAAE